jgi:hypothetical protein
LGLMKKFRKGIRQKSASILILVWDIPKA